MRSLMQLAEEASSTPLSEQDIDWLHLLLADWQVLADLAAADLVLWLPADDGRFIAAAHCRPATSTTVHVDDIIGLHLPAAREIDLRNSRTRVPDGEEKFWVYGQACCLTAPIHDLSFAPRVLCAWVSCALFQCPLGHLSRARSCQQ